MRRRGGERNNKDEYIWRCNEEDERKERQESKGDEGHGNKDGKKDNGDMKIKEGVE